MPLDFKLVSKLDTNLESNDKVTKTLVSNVRYQLFDLIGH